MADKLAIMAELNRRGKLPPDKAALFAEAVKRGLVPSQSEAAPQGIVPGFTPGTPPSPDQVKALAGQYGNTVNGQAPPAYQQPSPRPDLMSSIGATVQGLTGSIPGLNQASDALLAGGQTIGDIFANRPGSLSQHYGEIQQQRNRVAEQAPVAQALGGVGGMMAGTGALGALPGGMEALGLAGLFGKQLLNSSLATAGYEGLQGLAHGHTGAQLLGDEGIGGISGLGGSLLGQGLNKAGEGISNAVTKRTQSALTKTAIADAPAASDLFSAGAQLFDASTGGTPLQVTKDAYGKLLDRVQVATQKFRPNENTSKEAVGVLQKFSKVASELADPSAGVAVDFKDLHILRQSAQRVTQQAQASDESKEISGIIVRQIDDFIKSLKPGDIAGGADPKEAGNALLTAISTWHKASKVSMIEDAIKQADTYKTSYETGLKTAFTNLMKTPEYKSNIFTQIEKDAIRQVAKGTPGQNLAELIGRMGFTLKGGIGANMIGGGGSTAALTGAFAPLGPFAFPAALATTTTAGKIGREISSHIGISAANRAAQIMATDAIPVARQAPNLLAPLAKPLSIMVRGGIPATAGAR